MLFKAQALNRRAKQFPENMQLTIIQAPVQDKQVMFEAAEVLFEVIKAVEQNKKALKLDYTPYKLYELRKKKESKPQEQPLEIIEDVDPAEKQRRREIVQQSMAKQAEYLREQKEKLQMEHEKRLRDQQRLQNKKDALMDEYHEVKEGIKSENEKKKQLELKQKKEQDRLDKRNRVQEKEEEAKEEKKQELKAQLLQHRRELRSKQNEVQQRLHASQQREELSAQQRQAMRERAEEKAERKNEFTQEQKTKKMSVFFAWVKSKPIAQIVNTQFKKGLFVKYEQAMNLSQSTTGVSLAGWTELMKQAGVNQMVEPKVLIKIHSASVKESAEIGDYNQYFKPFVEKMSANSKDAELSYGAFVSALIKVANLRHVIKKSDAKFASQRHYSDYSEYNLVDQQGTAFTEFLKFINVAEKKT